MSNFCGPGLDRSDPTEKSFSDPTKETPYTNLWGGLGPAQQEEAAARMFRLESRSILIGEADGWSGLGNANRNFAAGEVSKVSSEVI